MAERSRPRTVLAAIMIASMAFVGCLGGGESVEDSTVPWDLDYQYIDLPSSYEDPRNFTVAAPFSNTTWGNASWTVYGNEHGGNCCEHYLAATKEGWILNFGGEYPTWSEDRGLTWQ
jgi:hypothetical protein